MDPNRKPCYCSWPAIISTSANTCEPNDAANTNCPPGTKYYCSKISADACVHDSDCVCALVYQNRTRILTHDDF